jgi:uncharacterized membrane protein YhaH (DUF805 family)
MIGFVEAIRNGFEQYASARGRASRAEFWWWWLAVSLVSGLTEGSALGTLVILALLLPSITVLVRRLHDTGRSAWWLLVSLVPGFGALIILFLLVLPSDTASNAYGPPRIPSTTGGRTGGGWSGGDPGPRGGAPTGDPSPGGWPHGGDTPPRSSGWDDLPPPPPTGR